MSKGVKGLKSSIINMLQRIDPSHKKELLENWIDNLSPFDERIIFEELGKCLNDIPIPDSSKKPNYGIKVKFLLPGIHTYIHVYL